MSERETEGKPPAGGVHQWRRWAGHYTVFGGLIYGQMQVLLGHPHVQLEVGYYTQMQVRLPARETPLLVNLEVPSILGGSMAGHLLPCHHVTDPILGQLEYDIHIENIDEATGLIVGTFNLSWPSFIRGSFELKETRDPIVRYN